MLRISQVLIFNSDLQIVFGQQRAAQVELNFTELVTTISAHLHQNHQEVFQLNNWQVACKRLNSAFIIVLLARTDDDFDAKLLSAYLSDLQAIFQQLFPSCETDFYQHTERVHSLLDEVLF